LYAMYYYESLGENVSLFVANKLAYFYQRIGEPVFGRLNFTANRYGPYSPAVAHIIHSLNGKYIKGVEQMTNKAFEPFELRYDKLPEVSKYIHLMTKDRQQRVKDLIKLIFGFQSALSLEVLASVDFIRKDHPDIGLDDTILAIHNWSERKKDLFKPEYISLAYNRLEQYSNYFARPAAK